MMHNAYGQKERGGEKCRNELREEKLNNIKRNKQCKTRNIEKKNHYYVNVTSFHKRLLNDIAKIYALLQGIFFLSQQKRDFDHERTMYYYHLNE